MKVLALIDMDSFYTQVEVKRDPNLRGQPVVVVQYNPYGDLRTLKPTDVRLFPDSNGSIIAASYEARKYGVKRNMMAQAAKKLCPELKVVQVPVAHGKADIGIYREAGAQVISVLSNGVICERASVDEAYLDVTATAQQMLATAAAARHDNSMRQEHGQQQQQGQQGQLQQEEDETGQMERRSVAADGRADDEGGVSCGVVVPLPESVEGWHVAGMDPGADGVSAWWQQAGKTQDDQLLAAGAVIVARLRAAVKQQLGFTCSAGIAHSKILAKLGAGLNKPAQQTLVPAAAVADLLNPLPIGKLRALGGKFGEELSTSLGISTVGELAAVPLNRLEAAVGEETAAWLARLAQGIDDLEVKPRTLPKSISCGKTFRGNTAITGLSAVHKWLQELGKELQERIEADRKDHQRLPGLLTVSIDTLQGGSGAAAGTGAAAAAMVAAAVGQNAAAAVAANGGRHTAQTWRAGAVNVSRSCNLRRPVAEVMAEDALKLVKKWARDRADGWKIIGMFLSASNFVAAPTGASTLERFMAAAGPQQEQQEHLNPTGAGASDRQVMGGSDAAASGIAIGSGSFSSSPVSGSKRPAAAAIGGSKKRAYGDLRAFLAPSTAAAAAAAATAALGDVIVEVPKFELQSTKAAQEAQQQELVAPAVDDVQQEQQQHQQLLHLAPAPQQQQQQAESGQSCDNAVLCAAAQIPAPSAASSIGPAAGQARSVLTALQQLSPAGASVATQQQQHPHEKAGRAVDQQRHWQQQEDLAQHTQQDSSQQPQQHQQQPMPACGPGADGAIVQDHGIGTQPASSCSQQQPSLLSPVVGSLSGWIGTSQQQPVGLQQTVHESCPGHEELTGTEFKFPSMQEQQEDIEQPMDPLAPAQQDSRSSPQNKAAESARPENVTGAAAEAPAAAGGDSGQQQPTLRMSDIDPTVLAELPYHIQVEVRRAAGQRVGSGSGTSSASKHGRGRGGKQQQKGQQGGISKYFGKNK